MKHASIIAAAFLLTACPNKSGDGSVSDPVMDAGAAQTCPVIESRNWRAFVDAEPPGARLYIEGEVVLPTPGYVASWRLGIADRMMPPGQHVHLEFQRPDGLVIQVLTTEQVSFKVDPALTAYRVIHVHCGDQVLAEITDIPVGL